MAFTYAVNELGDNAGVVALAILVLDQTGSAWGTAALFVAARFVPAFVAPWLTARVDGWSPRRSLPALYGGEAATFAVLALLAADGFSLPAVLALALLDGTLALTARGVTRGTVAALLTPSGALRSGNAALNLVLGVTSAIGPLLGGALVAASGVSFALSLDAGSFALIAVLLATASGLPRGKPEDARSLREKVREGVDAVRRSPKLRFFFAAESVAYVFFFVIAPAEVVFVKDTLGAGDTAYGALLTAWGVGLLIGSFWFLRVGKTRPLPPLVVASTALIGVSYLGIGVSPGIVLACALSVVGGLGNGVQVVAAVTTIQERTSDALQTRVSGLFESMAAAAPGAGYVLGGALTALSSARLAYLVAGVGVIGVAAAMHRRVADL